MNAIIKKRMHDNETIITDVSEVRIEIDDQEFRLSERLGQLTITTPNDSMVVKPSVSNQIKICEEKTMY